MHISQRLADAGVTFAPPADDDFWRLDLSPVKLPLVIIAGLMAIYEETASGVASQSDKIPTAAPVNVTDTVTTIAAASTTKPRKLGVYNNGAANVMIIEGNSNPGFSGQGDLAADFGIKVVPGGYFESPVAHCGPIKARAANGTSSYLTVTHY